MEEQFRRNYNAKIVELSSKKDCSSSHLTGERYKWIIDRLKNLRQKGVKKAAKDYRLLKKYEIVCVAAEATPNSTQITKEDSIGEQVERLRKPNTSLQYVSHDELFDVVKGIHVATEHGARDIMRGKARKRYANVTKEVLQLYIDLCDECQEKKTRSRKAYGVKPSAANALKVRGDVQVIDMQTERDENYQFILRYEDLSTGFVWLRPLRTKRAEEVANHLTDIFCTFGSPYILQTDDTREFTKKIVDEVKTLWPACALVHGTSIPNTRHDDDQKADVKSLIDEWMKENKTNGWAYGLRFVQWQSNNMKHKDVKRTPYSTMFYEEARLGVNSIPLLRNDVVCCLESEEELQNALITSNVGASSTVAITTTSTVRSDESVQGSEVINDVPQQKSSSIAPLMIVASNFDSDSRHNEKVRSVNEVKLRSSTALYNEFSASRDESDINSGIFNDTISPTESRMDIVFQEQDVITDYGDAPTRKIRAQQVSTCYELVGGGVVREAQSQRSSFEDIVPSPCLLGMVMVCSVCEFACNANLKCILCNNFCHEKPPCSKILEPESRSLLCLMCEMKSEMLS